MLSVDFDDASDSSSQVLAYGLAQLYLVYSTDNTVPLFTVTYFCSFSSLNSWTIDTKYYTADVSVRMAHLQDEFSIRSLPIYQGLAALVMVFDMNDVSLFLLIVSLLY